MNMQSIYDKRNCECYFCRSKAKRSLRREMSDWLIFFAVMAGIAKLCLFW